MPLTTSHHNNIDVTISQGDNEIITAIPIDANNRTNNQHHRTETISDHSQFANSEIP